MADNAWDRITRSQRAAAGLFTDTVTKLVEMGKVGVTRPDELLSDVAAMAGAIGELAGSTARPLEMFLDSQRQLAETMTAFAVLQRQLADLLDQAAASQAAVVQALELMANPMLGVAHRLRRDGDADESPET